jgi:hypothetical protein
MMLRCAELVGAATAHASPMPLPGNATFFCQKSLFI